jgi:hypothetical protein
LRRAAQRAFIASESFFRPAAVNPRRRPEAFAAVGAVAVVVVVPLRRAQRARAAAANLARVAADIGRRPRRRPPLRRPSSEEGLVDPPKRVDNFCSSELICCLRESASVNF